VYKKFFGLHKESIMREPRLLPRPLRALARLTGVSSFVLLLVVILLHALAIPVDAQSGGICADLTDRTTLSISGVVNTYFPGLTATAGITQIAIGAGRGANVNIASGDLLLIMQMQDATITYTNNISYGSGTGTGAGYLAANNVGRYEYVVARSSATFAAGGALTVEGGGSGGGLLNTYTNADATTTSGQRRFQVIRVPTYLTTTLAGTVTAPSWNGSTGGVVVLEASTTLSFSNQVVNVSGLGFRGGGGRQLTGSTGVANTDFTSLSISNTNGSKGEGIAGTPRFLTYTGALITITYPAGIDGYPNGSYARGAPGTAGGGGTDGRPSNNDQNSGGGGGGNGGAGGLGGNSWNTNLTVGGRGGAVFSERAPNRIVMGGGGGAGTTNDGTGTPGNGLASSGGPGGGIVIIRARQIAGSGSILADGGNTLNVLNDSTGGGGAGGSVIVLASETGLGGLSVSAKGGNAGTAWAAQLPNGNPGARHGPGGGGGGGVAYLSSSSAALTVTGGLSGTTTTAQDNYGALAGANGFASTSITVTDIPGADPNFNCYTPTVITLNSMTARAEADLSATLPFVIVTGVGALVLIVRAKRQRSA
jgi:hypothetical protein